MNKNKIEIKYCNRSVLHETCAKCKGDIGREKICKQKDRVKSKYYYKTLYL